MYFLPAPVSFCHLHVSISLESRTKGSRDVKLLNDNKTIKDEHNARREVILTHQSPYYATYSSKVTSTFLLKKKPGFFKEWVSWAPDVKLLYDTLLCEYFSTRKASKGASTLVLTKQVRCICRGTHWEQKNKQKSYHWEQKSKVSVKSLWARSLSLKSRKTHSTPS